VLPKILAFAMNRDRMRRLAFRTISQIGIRYPRSPLSQTLAGLPDSAPRAGDRFPWLRLRLSPNGPIEDFFARLDDTRFNLVLIGQPWPPDCPSDRNDLILTHRVFDDPVNDQDLSRTRIPKPSFFLLRPDGHVGLAGTRLEAAALTRYLAERVTLRIARSC
jgi:hypothetical protein